MPTWSASPEKNGWNYDPISTRLDFGYQGTRAGHINDSSVSLALALLPTANDVAALGSTSYSWGDLFLASGAVVNFNSGDVTLTHASNSLTVGGGDIRVDTGFGLSVGSTTQATISDGGGATNLVPEGQFHGVGSAFAGGSVLIATYNTTNDRTVSPKLAFLKGAAATQVATTVVADNEVVGSIIWYGSDSSDFESPVAAIEAVINGTPGAGDMPGSLEFFTTADSGETLTIALTIGANQNASFGGDILTAAGKGLVIGSTGKQNLPGPDATNQFYNMVEVGTSATSSGFALARHSADAGGAVILGWKSRHASAGGQTLLQDGDVSLHLVGGASDGAAADNVMGSIRIQADGTSGGANDTPGEIVFSTTADGARTVTDRLTIRNDGSFEVANGAPKLTMGTVSAFATTQPTNAIVLRAGTAPAGAITTANAIFSSTSVLRKIIAAGTVSDVG